MKEGIENNSKYKLTRAEREVMAIILKLKLCSVKETIEYYPNPKPAVTTVSTVIRVLEHKGFLSHVQIGRGYKYYPTNYLSV